MEDSTYTIEAPDGETDTVTLPADLVELFREADDRPVDVVGDVLQLAFTQRAHAVVHHGEGDPDEHLTDVEERALALFEERFGLSYAEATGHHH
ncbi:MAG: hypothetical protein ABEJ70_02000 [Halobacteriaceae archaeon]